MAEVFQGAVDEREREKGRRGFCMRWCLGHDWEGWNKRCEWIGLGCILWRWDIGRNLQKVHRGNVVYMAFGNGNN